MSDQDKFEKINSGEIRNHLVDDITAWNDKQQLRAIHDEMHTGPNSFLANFTKHHLKK